MKKLTLSFLLALFALQFKSQNFIRAHRSDTVNRVMDSYYYHGKIYFISKQNSNSKGPILNICNANGTLIRAVDLPWQSSSMGNFDFKDGNFLYATQNSVYRLDSLGNVIWQSYVVSNCTSGGFVVRSKFLNNGGVIVYGCSYSNLSIIKLDPSNGNLLGIRIININSAHPNQVPGNSQNFWAQDAVELSNSTIYFLLTRRDINVNYSENYIVKCTNDSNFIALKGLCLDNVLTNNNNTNTGRLSHLQVVSNSLVVGGIDFDSNTGDLQLIKLDTNLTTGPSIRYAVKAKAIGSNFYATLASVSNNNGKIYVGVTTSPNNCEASLLSFDASLTLQQWTGYDLDNQAYNYGIDCSIPRFQDPNTNLNMLYAITSYSNNGGFTRSILKADFFGHMTCGIALTPTIVTDSLHSDSVAVFSSAGANGTNTYVTTSTLSAMYGDSVICSTIIMGAPEYSSSNGLSIYPNPASSSLNIESVVAIKEIEISDCMGRQVYFDSGTSNHIDLQKLKPGVYFIRVNTAEGTVNRKFVRE